MKSKLVVRSLMGSLIVYVAMAACVATETPSASTGAGGASGMGGGGFGGFVDAMMDPVPDADADVPNSGTRLKAKRYIAEDGARTEPLAYWYDSKRNEDCYFQYVGNGITRCTPLAIYTASSYYTDSACSGAQTLMFAFSEQQCVSLPKYVRTVASNACELAISLHTIGAKNGVVQVWSKLSDGTCADTTAKPPFEFYAVGPEVPMTEFVAATLTVDQ
jgi:hypothetical protein